MILEAYLINQTGHIDTLQLDGILRLVTVFPNSGITHGREVPDDLVRIIRQSNLEPGYNRCKNNLCHGEVSYVQTNNQRRTHSFRAERI